MDIWENCFSSGLPVGDPPYKITISCDECGHRNSLERPRWRDEDIRIICHGCEIPIVSKFRLAAHGL
jgi:hypothetical protein